ncbi:hypothetical protein LCGC14_2166460 [marine sediment metagenome]|uniref:Uncharacterized protein n=1 Tax=marine sediment metagenome TaxID=412755 RepID=A0A0F9G435_9ZZZZ
MPYVLLSYKEAMMITRHNTTQHLGPGEDIACSHTDGDMASHASVWIYVGNVTLFIREPETIDRLIAELEKAKSWLASNTTALHADATDSLPATTEPNTAASAAPE